jgi:hypothetical protein
MPLWDERAMPGPSASRVDAFDQGSASVWHGWHRVPNRGKGCAMTTDRPKPPTGAGAIIAFLVMAGTIIGGFLRQPSIGLLAGLGLGIIIAVILWRRERGR